jgi:undecaprenyl-diphosphatase
MTRSGGTKSGSAFSTSLFPGLALMAAALLIGLATVWFKIGGSVEADTLRAVALREGRSPDWVISVFQWITWAGDAEQRSIAMIAAGGWLLWKQRVRAALVMVIFPSVAGATSSILKQLFARARPEVVPHLDSFSNLSFPSGHATNAMAILLLAALLLPTRNRGLWLTLALISGATVGLSRNLLGVHWPSDVLAGWLWGAGFALTGFATAKRLGDARR